MASLVVINAAPNLSSWQRKIERTRALSHTSEIAHKRKKDARSWSQKLLTDRSDAVCDQSNRPGRRELLSVDGKHVNPSNDGLRATSSLQLASRYSKQINDQVQSIRHISLIADGAGEGEEDNDQMFLTAEIERQVSQAMFSNDFGCYRGMRTEPFGVVSKHASPAVDYYTQVVVPSYSALWKIFDVNNMVTQTYLEFIDTRVCLLTMILAPKLVTDPTWYPGKPLDESFLTGYNKALSTVRQYINTLGGRADISTLVAVVGLAILAGAMGDISSFQVHARSLSTLVELAGGFEKLGRFNFIKGLLLQWESQWAYQPGMRVTIFPDARAKYVACFPPYPFSSDVGKLVSKLPVGFRRLARKQHLSLRTLEILGRCADASAGNPLPCGREQFHPEQRRFADFFEACPFLAPGYVDPPPLEKFVIQALILYCVHQWSPLRFSWGLYRATKMDLTMGLLSRPLAAEHEKDVLVWIYMNLIDSWQSMEGSGRLMPQGKSIFLRLEGISGSIKDAAQVTPRTKLFFHNKRFIQDCEKCLEQEIVGKRLS